LPTASISPENSQPRVLFFGFLIPVNNLENLGSPFRNVQSVAVTVVALTFISTSFSFGSGFSISSILRTSGGPYFL